MRDARPLVAAIVGGLVLTPAQAQESRSPETEPPAAPDLAFLEYLGSWQEDDTEWLLVAEWEDDDAPPPVDARPETERDDSDE